MAMGKTEGVVYLGIDGVGIGIGYEMVICLMGNAAPKVHILMAVIFSGLWEIDRIKPTSIS
jgi:hypothetical protein